MTTGEHDSAEHDPVPSEQAEHDPVDQHEVEHDAGAPEQHEASPTPDGTCVRDAVAHCLHEHAAACDAAEHPDVCRSELEAQCKHSASETCSADDATPHSDGEHTDSGVAHPEGDQPAGDHDMPADQPAAGHGDEEPPPSEQHDAGTATGETCVHDTTAHCIEEGAHACETAEHPDVCRSELERACETAAHEHCG